MLRSLQNLYCLHHHQSPPSTVQYAWAHQLRRCLQSVVIFSVNHASKLQLLLRANAQRVGRESPQKISLGSTFQLPVDVQVACLSCVYVSCFAHLISFFTFSTIPKDRFGMLIHFVLKVSSWREFCCIGRHKSFERSKWVFSFIFMGKI